MAVDGLWAMGLGAVMLVYGLCYGTAASGRGHRRRKLCGLCGGSLFVLGILFVCTPQPYGGVVLWLWGGGAVSLLLAHEWLSPP